MFESIQPAPPDAILGLTEAFNRDTNPNRINLSVGVYKDTTGKTPILRCVKEAEKKLVDDEATKGYLGIDGLPDYRAHVRRLVFGDQVAEDRISILQTPGGTGGLRVAGDFIADQLKPARIWLSNPTWANHNAVFTSAGVQTEAYPYLNAEKTGLDFQKMLETLSTQASAGDIVLLHACCHNPSGVDPTSEQWAEIAKCVGERGLIPLVDFAYQGFGEGLESDAVGLRAVLNACDEAIVVNSFSKNFGLYSERVGAVSLVAKDAAAASAGLSQLKRLVRSNYSNPPRHGAAIVAAVLDDESLTQMWKEELTEMRERISSMRSAFVQQMNDKQSAQDFSFLLPQRGMFSFSGLSPMQVDQLKNEHSIYIVGSGRINVAGMTEENLPILCDAVASVID